MKKAPVSTAASDSGGSTGGLGLFSGAVSSLFGGAVAPASSTTAIAGTTTQSDQVVLKSSESRPEDIPKEELLHLCMKMNRRMQSLEGRANDAVKKHREERKALSDIIRILSDGNDLVGSLLPAVEDSNSAGGGGGPPAAIDLSGLASAARHCRAEQDRKVKALEDRCAQLEEGHAREIATIETRVRRAVAEQLAASPGPCAEEVAIGSHASAEQRANGAPHTELAKISFLSSEVDRLLSENQNLISEREALSIRVKEAAAEIERRTTSEDALKSQLSRSEASLRDMVVRSEEVAAAREQERVKFEERVLYLQMQINAMRSKEEAKEKEFAAIQALSDKQSAELRNLQSLAQDHAINAGDYKEVIRECHNRIQTLENDLERFRERESELLRNNAHGSVLKAEQESILANLRRELKSALLAKDEYAQMCAQLEEYRSKAEAKLAKMSEIARAVDEAREALEEKDSRIALLQSEAQVAERNHALRTAMLTTVEAHVVSLKAELKEKNEALASSKKETLDLQVRLDEADKNHVSSLVALTTDMEKIQQALETEKSKHQKEMESMQAQHTDTLDILKRDHAKKSAAARALLAERDEEVRVLSARVAEMQDEIASGAHNERRIFELAKQQSRREATHNIHSDTRELAFQQLQNALAAKDMELARIQQTFSQLSTEIGDLRRISRRENVNMDYLKNVVVQYMSLPPAAPERNALVPVITTLLQLNDAEQKTVQNAMKAPLWSSLPIKEVKPRQTSGYLSGVSVHRDSSISPKLKAPLDAVSRHPTSPNDPRRGAAAVGMQQQMQHPLLNRCDDERGAPIAGVDIMPASIAQDTDEVHM